jgi:hypothetical protein
MLLASGSFTVPHRCSGTYKVIPGAGEANLTYNARTTELPRPSPGCVVGHSEKAANHSIRDHSRAVPVTSVGRINALSAGVTGCTPSGSSAKGVVTRPRD